MVLKNKHWGSTLGIIAGILLILSELGNIVSNAETTGSYRFITALIVILTAVSYKKRKRQILNDQHKKSVLEIITGALFIYHFLIFGISHNLMLNHPIDFLLIPVWIITSYVLLLTGKIETIKNKI